MPLEHESGIYTQTQWPLVFLFMDNVKVMLPLSPFHFPSCTMTKSDKLHHELAYLSDMLYLLYRKPLCWNFARDAAYR